ncbi:hypothetical protein EJ05DRAFT_212422 [Pseudovirgaria hyperparasitica]|uniref:Uncharacterized protein n=1 Tax=Pseudovirgaria hyperparasitica TaxID=470096 RepID=A0A6A6VT05_9PEZI|nr:uncharacterized protein EJ05DRAFT_212422 [Pseudovirgaria hyperparasitica]KAF2753353.1 hypothetical protein EJ05DRAFT_212422 [Pseudovirgaria hyperparasitica]
MWNRWVLCRVWECMVFEGCVCLLFGLLASLLHCFTACLHCLFVCRSIHPFSSCLTRAAECMITAYTHCPTHSIHTYTRIQHPIHTTHLAHHPSRPTSDEPTRQHGKSEHHSTYTHRHT